MTKVYLTDDILPKGLRKDDVFPLGFYEFCHSSPFCVQKGEPVVIIHDHKYISETTLFAEQTGIVVFRCGAKGLGYHMPELVEGDLFYEILSNEEYIDYSQNSFSVVEDEFTKEKTIQWHYVFDGGVKPQGLKGFLKGAFRLYVDYVYVGVNHNRLFSTSSVALSFNYSTGAPSISIILGKDFLKPKPKINDSFHFLFVDGSVISFTIKEKSTRIDDDFIKVSFSLSKNDLDSFLTGGLQKIKFDCRGGESVIVENGLNIPRSITSSLFQRYACDYLSALKEVGYAWPEQNEITKQVSSAGSDPCYVYLMVDTTNGFHKIGISNNPEYREGTLQSEKPTIELVCAKQFPSRIIASAIESALHEAFGSKRLRGEWFKLDSNDINDIILTLK